MKNNLENLGNKVFRYQNHYNLANDNNRDSEVYKEILKLFNKQKLSLLDKRRAILKEIMKNPRSLSQIEMCNIADFLTEINMKIQTALKNNN